MAELLTMQPTRGAVLAARKIGVSVEDYLMRRANGDAWCSAHKDWHPVSEFSVDRARSTGLAHRCREAQSAYLKAYLRTERCQVCHVPSTGQFCRECYKQRGAERAAERATQKPYKRLAFAVAVVARRVLEEIKVAARGERQRRQALRRARWRHTRRREVATPISLDAQISLSDGSDLYKVVSTYTSVADDPAEIFMRDEAAATLRRITGEISPADVQRMTAWDLDRLRDRLADAGLVPLGVQESERDRLRAPERHTGGSVADGGGHGSRKKRREKIAHKAANRARGNSNRPAQKPRKRWDREELTTW